MRGLRGHSNPGRADCSTEMARRVGLALGIALGLVIAAALAAYAFAQTSAGKRFIGAQLEALWPGARLVPLDGVGAASFAAGARGQLRAPLLWLALLLGLIEMGLASFQRKAA